MAFDPDPFDFVKRKKLVQFLPKVKVFNFRFFVGGAPVVAFPVRQPFVNAVHDIAAVGVEGDFALAFESFQRFNNGCQFHAVVGGFPEPEREFLAVGACDEEDAQTSRSGVPACRSVGVYRDGCHGLFLRV